MIDTLTESRMMPRSRFKLLSSVARRVAVLLIGGFLLTVATLRDSVSAHSPLPIEKVSQDDIAQLEPGKYFERKLEGGKAHFYEIRLDGEQFLRVVVDQRGIDIALKLFGPDGGQLSNVDDRHGERGPEAASVISSTPGNVTLTVPVALPS